jgi:VPDSG-CTERM motif
MKTPSRAILTILVVGLVSCGLLCQEAHAIPITGTVTFAGGVEMDTGTVNTATMVTGWLDQMGNMPHVTSRDGSFTAFVMIGDTATFHAPWSFNSGAIASFWSVDNFTFDLIASSIVSQAGGFLTVSGTGTISGNNFDPTSGSWSFTAQDQPAGGVFSFSASTSAVPDGGSAVALLGLAFAGIEGLRRFLRVRRA